MCVSSSHLAEGIELLHHRPSTAPGFTRARQLADVIGLLHQRIGLRLFRCRIDCLGDLPHAFHGLHHQHSHIPGHGIGQATRLEFFGEKEHRLAHRPRALRVGTGAGRLGDFLRHAQYRVLLLLCHRSRPGRSGTMRSGLLTFLCSRVCTPRVRRVLGLPRRSTARPDHEKCGQRPGCHRRYVSHWGYGTAHNQGSLERLRVGGVQTLFPRASGRGARTRRPVALHCVRLFYVSLFWRLFKIFSMIVDVERPSMMGSSTTSPPYPCTCSAPTTVPTT
jgi:hypothetical protein